MEVNRQMSKNSRVNVPEARDALANMKYEIARELGVNLKQGYNCLLYTSKRFDAGLWKRLLYYARPFYKYLIGLSPVSYTHLDVYKRQDLRLAGTICVHMADGSVTYASRRYVSRIKTALGI